MARKLVVEIIGDASSLEKSLVTADRGARRFTRDMDKMGRGALAGTGLFRGFGRSIAFASGGFLAFASAGQFLRSSVDAAREAAVAHRALAAQMKASGESFAANREQVEKASLSYGKFGFQNDEVIASLTVLERGTGSINKAIGLQGLTADLARAKNIDLAAAAQTVAKVFGGQETALRRAIPGLEKSAHGWDLIRLAQAKLAGQAAANTTASERFQAVLHDTQEIVGGALLPTLNRYLSSLSTWLEEMNRSGRLQREVAGAAKFLSEAFDAAKTILGPFVEAFRSLAKITGSTKNALLLLAGAFAAFKFASLISSLAEVAAQIGLIGGAADASAVKVKILRASLLGPAGLVAAAGVAFLYMQKSLQDASEAAQKAQAQTFKQGDPLETTLVPRLAKQIEAMKRRGATSMGILAALRSQLGGSLKADDLIAEAFAYSSGADPKLRARIAAAAKRAVKTTDQALAEAAKGPSAALRSQWFDARIDRMIGRSQYAGLGQQVGVLKRVAELIRDRIAATRDITRRLDLEDKLLSVGAQIKQVREQIVQRFVDALQFNVTKAGATARLGDDLIALHKLEGFLQRRIRVVGHTLDLEQQLFDVQQQINDVLTRQAEQRRQAAERRAEAQQARQFRALGLGPTGEALVPGIRQLRRTLARVREAIAGTALETPRRRGLLATIYSELTDPQKWGALSRDVRQKIAEILAGIDKQLKDHADAGTRFKHTSSAALLAGLGLSGPQYRALQIRLAGVGPGGAVPAHSGQFTGGVTVHGDVHVHGVQNPKQLEDQLMKRSKQRAHLRRASR